MTIRHSTSFSNSRGSRFITALALMGCVALTGACMEPEDEGSELLAETFDADAPWHTGWIDSETGPRQVSYQVVDGLNLMQGDIELPPKALYSSFEEVPQAGTAKAASRANTKYLWSGKRVPYEMHSSLTGGQSQDVDDAIAHWNATSSLQLVPRSGEKDFVRFRRRDGIRGCGSSPVGRQGGRQLIRLKNDWRCGAGTVIHEIGHAIGSWHEHTRSDRDKFIIVDWDEIQSGAEGNFDVDSDTLDIGLMDFGSVMMYSSTAFQDGTKPTMTRLDGTTWTAQRNALSAGDRWGVRARYGLRSSNRARGSFTSVRGVPMTGDFDGDGQDDIVNFVHESRNRQVWVALSDGDKYGSSAVWLSDFCARDHVCQVGDVNGDGKDDVLSFVRSSSSLSGRGDVMVALSSGAGFGTPKRWHGSFCLGAEICEVGDFNGDGRDDIAAFVRSSKSSSAAGDVWVALSSGSSFGGSLIWHTSFCYRDEVCRIGDVDGDGRDDILAMETSGSRAGRVWVAQSMGFGFAGSSVWATSTYCRDGIDCRMGDINGDGKDDIVAFLGDIISYGLPLYREVQGYLSDGSGFDGVTSMRSWGFCADDHVCTLGDVNGDGLDDAVAFELGSTGDVHVAR